MTTLTDRYVAAVLRLIPEAHREDIQAELQAAIADATDERVASGQTPQAAERTVLNDLGEPARLAAEYSHRPLWLIGPDYYLAWLRSMRWLLWTLPAFLGIGNAALRLAFGEPVLDALWWGLGVAAFGVLNAVVWPTVGFIIAERSPDAKPSDLGPLARWSVEQLPATAIVDRRFSLASTIGGAVLNVFLIVLLSSLLGLQDVPIRDVPAWTIGVTVMIVLLAASTVARVMRYARGRWTTTLAIINAILNAAFAAWWIWVLWNLSILDPQFVARLNTEAGLLTGTRITALVIAAVCAWDTIAGFVGTWRPPSAGLRVAAAGSGSQ